MPDSTRARLYVRLQRSNKAIKFLDKLWGRLRHAVDVYHAIGA